MDSGTKFLTFTSIIILFVLVQAFLIVGEQKKADTPGKAAIEFAQAYFKLDESMAKRLCSEITDDEELNVVNDYLQRVSQEAAANGFERKWMRFILSHVETKTHMADESMAEVEISAGKRRYINPVFATVARIFFLGETYHFEDTLTLIKEGDAWKVCGEPFALIEG